MMLLQQLQPDATVAGALAVVKPTKGEQQVGPLMISKNTPA
jgi:hypothetical protein